MGGGNARLEGANRPVNPGATDRRDITAHNSPSLARNPMNPGNLAVVNRIDQPLFSCALHVSADNGATWAPSAIPFPAGRRPSMMLRSRCGLWCRRHPPPVVRDPEGIRQHSQRRLVGLVEGRGTHAFLPGPCADRTAGLPGAPGGRSAATQPPLPVLVAGVGHRWFGVGRDRQSHQPVPLRRRRRQLVPARAGELPARERAIAPSAAVGARGELYVLYLDLGRDSLDYHGGREGSGGEPYGGTWSLVLAHSSDQGPPGRRPWWTRPWCRPSP